MNRKDRKWTLAFGELYSDVQRSLCANTEPFSFFLEITWVVAPSDRAGQTTIADHTELNRV